MNLFRTKSIEALIKESEGKEQFKKTLGATDLILLGLGAIIGTGIFVLTGIAAAKHAGPALMLSFILSALACGFAAMAYAEFASMVPLTGSAYTYSYGAFGEFFAWLLGWALILEYGLAVSAVSVGWSAYLVKVLGLLGLSPSPQWIAAPGNGGIINLPAVAILLTITYLIARGIRESANVNNIIVAAKLLVIGLFIIVGVSHVQPANWSPFLPFGWEGVFSGAAVIFFAFIGFDAVSTATEEVINPERNLPIGIVGSLAIATVLYIIVTAIMTGVVPYHQLDTPAPVALVMQASGAPWVVSAVSVGALAGITTVLIVMLYGQTRIFYAMSRDGLLPPFFGRLHPRYKTPYGATWLVGTLLALVGGLVPLNILAEVVNLGTLAAFTTVSVGIIWLRRTKPHLRRPFRCPGVPYTPLLAILFCLFLAAQLPAYTWTYFFLWMVIGLAIYFLYGYRNSKLAETQEY